MSSDDPIDRRAFLGAGTASILGLPSLAQAQQSGGAPSAATAPAATVAADNGKTLSELIADFVTGFELKDAPPIVIERARVAFIDTIGVMLAGSQLPPADIVCDVIGLDGSAPAATIVGRSLRTAPRFAALANGVAGHSMVTAITYMAGQSVAAVIPAILPVAETTGATQGEMLAAFIVAAEVAGRIYRAGPKAWRGTAWHSTGVVGTTAAALACTRLMNISADNIPHFVCITASMASGVTANFGTMTKPLHSGHAAQNGVLAAMRWRPAATANRAALESGTGYFGCFLHGFDWSAAFDDLGKTFDLEDRLQHQAYPRVVASATQPSTPPSNCARWSSSTTLPTSKSPSPSMPRAATVTNIRNRRKMRSSAALILRPIRSSTARRCSPRFTRMHCMMRQCVLSRRRCR